MAGIFDRLLQKVQMIFYFLKLIVSYSSLFRTRTQNALDIQSDAF